MSDFEVLITDYCRKYNAQGVICGHVHKAAIKEINGIEYMNDGDWVESCTALVENHVELLKSAKVKLAKIHAIGSNSTNEAWEAYRTNCFS